MKPLVYYCRWQDVTLRLHGRDPETIWGQLVGINADGRENLRSFRYKLESAELIIYDDQGDHHLRLDEKGIPLQKEEEE